MAAIASIAFGEAAPVVDGNVARVLTRFDRVSDPPDRAAVRRRLEARAGELLDAARPGDGNQALMELGARICAPRAPRCPACPWSAGCLARAAGNPIFHVFMAALTDLLREVQYRYPDQLQHREASLRFHERIDDAVQSRDASAASSAMREHIQYIAERL